LLIRLRYFARFKKRLNLNNPQTLNEKILYLSLRTDTTLWTRCADKYEVRSFVKERGLGDTLIPLIGLWNSVTDIDISKLPNEFILKTTHGSGDNVIVKDKSKLNWNAVVTIFKKELSKPYGALEAGLHYMRIKPRIIAEKLIINDAESAKESSSLIDYKLWCFNGKCYYIWACTNRNKQSVDVMIYDCDWIAHPEFTIPTNRYHRAKLFGKPTNLEIMIGVAEKLAEGFPCVRVDLYNVGGKIYFGEMTFTGCGGLIDSYTEKFQQITGSLIDLSGIEVIN
jgi:hypothetical protein